MAGLSLPPHLLVPVDLGTFALFDFPPPVGSSFCCLFLPAQKIRLLNVQIPMPRNRSGFFTRSLLTSSLLLPSVDAQFLVQFSLTLFRGEGSPSRIGPFL